jgi:anti-sigma B factor antagonist
MSEYQHLDVTKIGDVTVVRFRNRRIAKEIDVQEFGSEMSSLVENDKPAKLLLNFSTVEYLGSPALGRLVTLERKLKTLGGAMKLSNIRPSIYEILAIVKLDRLFDVKDDEADALAAFSAI